MDVYPPPRVCIECVALTSLDKSSSLENETQEPHATERSFQNLFSGAQNLLSNGRCDILTAENSRLVLLSASLNNPRMTLLGRRLRVRLFSITW